ncbi:MAG: fenitrothion hydrolase [Solirubrobacteraceae bacterium]
MTSARRALPLLCGLLTIALLLPAVAVAHGIVGKADLPIPVWLFSWTAAIVLVVSFVALSTLWRTPQLQGQHRRRLLSVPAGVGGLASLVGLGLFGLTLYSGFAGAQVTAANFSVTFIYVIFWVGIPILSLIFGEIFSALSPWRTVARTIWWARRKLSAKNPEPLLGYPQWLGCWPAVAGLIGFGWLELVYVNRDKPSLLAVLSLGYFLAMLAGMTLCGVEDFGERADGFAVYFHIVSRLSALCRDERGALCLRRPLSAITELPMRRGTVAVLCTIIGTTTFDGFSNGGIWRKAEPSVQSLFSDFGLHEIPAQELAYSLGLVFCILLVAGIYRLGIAGVRSVSDRYDSDHLTRAFAHTLAPIGMAYVLAHYFSFVVWQGQAMGYLISDPLGNGTNLFGTSAYQIDYQIISYAAIWYVQVAALVCGHVAGLALAHDRALVIYRDPHQAMRSQYWMLVVMVAFTSFGLWLLSAVGT